MKGFLYTSLITIGSLVFGLVLAGSSVQAAAVPASDATASAQATSSVMLVNSFQTASTTFSSSLQQNTFYVQFAARATSTPANIVLQLTDQNDSPVASQSWEKTTFVKTLSKTQTIQNTISLFNSTSTSIASSTAQGTNQVFALQAPTHLVPGVYTWKAGIFKPDWKGGIQWYNNVATFAVLGTTTSKTPDVVLLGGTWQPNHTIYTTQNPYIFATFNTNNLSVPRYLEITLLDSNNTIIAQKGKDDMYIDPSYQTSMTMTGPTLPAGNYHWAIAVYSLKREKLYTWKDNVEPFTVVENK